MILVRVYTGRRVCSIQEKEKLQQLLDYLHSGRLICLLLFKQNRDNQVLAQAHLRLLTEVNKFCTEKFVAGCLC